MTDDPDDRILKALPVLETVALKLEEAGYAAPEVADLFLSIGITIGLGISDAAQTARILRALADRVERHEPAKPEPEPAPCHIH